MDYSLLVGIHDCEKRPDPYDADSDENELLNGSPGADDTGKLCLT